MPGGNHETIELRAYELWEQEGRPFGRAEEFWFRASTEVTTNGAAVKPKKAASTKAKAATTTKSKAVAEPAAKPKKTAAVKTSAKKKS